MSIRKILAVALFGIFVIPATAALAELPAETSTEVLPTPTALSETLPDSTEAPAEGTEVDLDLDLEFLELPKRQNKIRACTAQEAASIGCPEEDCLCISNTPRCFF